MYVVPVTLVPNIKATTACNIEKITENRYFYTFYTYLFMYVGEKRKC